VSQPKWQSEGEALLTCYSITKLMGESFKLHAQALTGYEDAMVAEAEQKLGSPTPQLQPHTTEVTAF